MHLRPLLPLAFGTALALPLVVFAQHEMPAGAAAMHGATPKGPAVLAEVSLAAGLKDKGVEAFLRDFAKALQTHDGKPLLPRLAAGYSIEGLPAEWDLKDSFLKAVGMITGPTEMVVTGIKRAGDTKVATVEFRFPTRIASKTFTFDAQDKLLATDLIALKRAPAPAATAEKK